MEAPVYCQGITLPPPSLCIEPLIPPLPPEPIKELPPEPEIVEPVWSCGVAQEDSDPKPGDFIFVEEEPHPTNMMDLIDCIKYPGYLSQAEITGAVVVRILVDEYGHYRKHIIIRQAHPALAKAVEACIDQLQFTPAIQGKQPIKFWVNVPFTFRTYE